MKVTDLVGLSLAAVYNQSKEGGHFNQENCKQMNETVMQNPEQQNEKMQSLLASFRQVGLPLLRVLAEVPAEGRDGSAPLSEAERVAHFNALVDSTVHLSQEMAKAVGAHETDLEAAVRWALSGSASQVVAANYRATGKPMANDEASRLAGLAIQLQEKFKTQIPAGGETAPNTLATFRAKVMESMVPVIGAVAQYAFGRGEHELLAEVADKLVKMADQVTRTLAAPGSTAEQWRLLCWNVLRAAGQIYSESHYAEADRILYMAPDERAAYLAQHGTNIPMTQVWQAFNQRMAMLATLATYLEVPETAQLEKQE